MADCDKSFKRTVDCRWPAWDGAPTPEDISGALKWELRQHFQPGRFLQRKLEEHVWVSRDGDEYSMDETRTAIIIENNEVPRREITGVCPSIVVKRGALKSHEFGLLQNGTTGITAFPNAGRTHTGLFLSPWQIFCSSVNPGLAERIGWEVFLYFSMYARTILQAYNLSKFWPSEMSEIGVEPSEGPSYVVVIGIDIAFNLGWEVAAQAPRLKNVDFKGLKE